MRLKNQVMKKVVGTMNNKFIRKYNNPNYLRVPITIQNGMCQVAYKSPKIKLDLNGVYFFCRAGKATPRQPTSSSVAIVRKIIFAIEPPPEIGKILMADCGLNRLKSKLATTSEAG